MSAFDEQEHWRLLVEVNHNKLLQFDSLDPNGRAILHAAKQISDLHARLAAVTSQRDQLLTASEQLRNDLLMRADVDSSGRQVVAAGASCWLKFKEAINVARGSEQ